MQKRAHDLHTSTLFKLNVPTFPPAWLQREVLGDLKKELREGLLLGVDKVAMRPVLRNYAFERPEILHGRQWVLKVKVPVTIPPPPFDAQGT